MKCNHDVFTKGHFLTDLTQQPGPMPTSTLNQLCDTLTSASKGTITFDWHPIGGRPQLLYLGNYDDAKKLFIENGKLFRDAAEKYYNEWHDMNPDMAHFRDLNWKSTLGLDEESIASPGRITIGQAMHGHVEVSQ